MLSGVLRILLYDASNFPVQPLSVLNGWNSTGASGLLGLLSFLRDSRHCSRSQRIYAFLNPIFDFRNRQQKIHPRKIPPKGFVALGVGAGRPGSGMGSEVEWGGRPAPTPKAKSIFKLLGTFFQIISHYELVTYFLPKGLPRYLLRKLC